MSDINHILNQLVTKHPDGRVKFPTVCGCVVCGGVTQLVARHDASPEVVAASSNRSIAASVAQIQHGYYLAKWEGQNVANAANFPVACNCECDHEFTHHARGEHAHHVACDRCQFSGTIDSSD